MELRNPPLARVTGELETALVGPFKDVGAFSTLLLVTDVPSRTVVYERTKSVAVVVTPALAVTDNKPSTVVVITVVYLEFRLDIKDTLGRLGNMAVEPFRGRQLGTEANLVVAEAAVLDVAILLAVFVDVAAILASTWMLTNNGDGELALSAVAVH